MREPRIFYAAGPGDVVGNYGHWKNGGDNPKEVAITYSGQFYHLCKNRGIKGLVISYNPRKSVAGDDLLTVIHRPIPLDNCSGALYHLGQIWSGFRMAVSAARFGADLAVVSAGTHWFALWFMRMFGIQVVPTVHCVFWDAKGPPRGTVKKLIQKFNSFFFRHGVFCVMAVSHDIRDQLKVMTGDRFPHVEEFNPTYRPESFAGMPPAPPKPPFRVFFAGRIERNKGVFDLLDIARQFREQGHSEIEFDLCGSGSMFDTLKEQVEKAGLTRTFRLHGHASKPLMRQMYETCHVVIVPTTSDFIEGFNKVVAEGVLAGRPVITSSACPALAYVRNAVAEVPPDDVQAYANAILALAKDDALYKQKIEGCKESQPQFYDLSRGWSAALERVVERWKKSNQ